MSAITGYHGPVTATLDWCEANYQFSYYIAEMANTLSNFFTIYLAVQLALNASRESLPPRYIVGAMGVAIVGLGSLAFHATLLYEAQLADELPMIFVASLSLWLMCDRKLGFTFESQRSRYQLVILILFNVLFTWSYYLYRNPIYHQVVFACLVIGTTLRVTYLLRWSDSRERVPEQQRKEIGQLLGSGAGLFAFGFFIWNLDNIFCATITAWKVRIGWPMAFLLEGHAWWHIFTGAGTYLMSIGTQHVMLCIKDDYRKFTLTHRSGLPYIKRVEKTKQL